ncbi:MAG: hypothetical protein U0350_03920 [Caldilineaceae bacterium]
MIVLDENIQHERLIHAIAAWYTGRVISITDLRPETLIKDDGISMLLQQVAQPTFVTINVNDFWLKFRADQRCCIVALALTQAQANKIPDFLRRVVRLPEFRTKSARMGKIIYVAPSYIEFYAADRQIHRLVWPD